MTEFETATLSLQAASLWTGYGQLAIAFVQTLILAYGVYVMRGMSADRQADAKARDRETAQR